MAERVGKDELVRNVAKKVEGVSIADTSRIVGALIDEIKEQVENGKDVILIDFGTFKKSVYSSRNGINPSTGEAIRIPEKAVCSFKMSSKWKNRLNE